MVIRSIFALVPRLKKIQNKMYDLFMYQLNLKKTTKALMFTIYAQGGS